MNIDSTSIGELILWSPFVIIRRRFAQHLPWLLPSWMTREWLRITLAIGIHGIVYHFMNFNSVSQTGGEKGPKFSVHTKVCNIHHTFIHPAQWDVSALTVHGAWGSLTHFRVIGTGRTAMMPQWTRHTVWPISVVKFNSCFHKCLGRSKRVGSGK